MCTWVSVYTWEYVRMWRSGLFYHASVPEGTVP